VLIKARTISRLKKAYKRLAMKHHPDRNADDKTSAEKKFKEIQIYDDSIYQDVSTRYVNLA
jgi:DnaJ-class molecular chaperone